MHHAVAKILQSGYKRWTDRPQERETHRPPDTAIPVHSQYHNFKEPDQGQLKKKKKLAMFKFDFLVYKSVYTVYKLGSWIRNPSPEIVNDFFPRGPWNGAVPLPPHLPSKSNLSRFKGRFNVMYRVLHQTFRSFHSVKFYLPFLVL